MGGDSLQSVHGQATFLRTDRGILVTGRVSVVVEATCARCLAPFTQPLQVHFEEEYLPTVEVLTGLPLSRVEDKDTFTIDERHQLDLSEAIRQYFLLDIPLKPLCRPDCAGLCPICGVNRNQSSCQCALTIEEGPWDELKRWAVGQAKIEGPKGG